MQVHLKMKSGNSKTGPIPVSTTAAQSCPTDCAYRGNGCYAASGRLALHWAKVSSGERGVSWGEFCETIASMPDGTLWRHNQAGDLPSDGKTIDAGALERLVAANTGKRGFTYTHHHGTDNFDQITLANLGGFTVNLSANNVDHADQLADTGLPVVVADRSIIIGFPAHGSGTKKADAVARRTFTIKQI